MKLIQLWPALAVIAGFIACGGSSDDDGSGNSGGTSGKGGSSAGKSATGGSGTTGGSSSGGSSGKGGNATGGNATGGNVTGGTGNEAGASNTAGTTGAAGAGGTAESAGGAGGETASGGAGGAPGCVTLTIKNYANWCQVQIGTGAFASGTTLTACLDAGTIDVAAKANDVDFTPGTFKIVADMWHHTDNDAGTQVAGVSSTTKSLSSDACIWVCCPFTNGTGCPVSEQCL
ncbi:MAG TPA: hypothetical protein VGP93_12540 [Polyangiaceae bacterium]|nr:hypothetical protein [Polyangiaceae bacterium]